MSKLPEHGTIRRYRTGCRCSTCTAKNTAEKAKERERRRQREGKPATPRRAPRSSVPTVPTDPTTAAPADDAEEVLTVRGALERALRAVETPDDMARFRKVHALQLASVLDDTSKSHQWRGITTSLAEVLAALVGNSGPKDGEADALRDFMEAIGSSRGRRNGSPVHDPKEPGA